MMRRKLLHEFIWYISIGSHLEPNMNINAKVKYTEMTNASKPLNDDNTFSWISTALGFTWTRMTGNGMLRRYSRVTLYYHRRHRKWLHATNRPGWEIHRIQPERCAFANATVSAESVGVAEGLQPGTVRLPARRGPQAGIGGQSRQAPHLGCRRYSGELQEIGAQEDHPTDGIPPQHGTHHEARRNASLQI